MELLYVEEHRKCFNFSKEEGSEAKITDYQAGCILNGENRETEFVFVLKGSLKLSYEKFRDVAVASSSMVLVPAGTHFSLTFEEDTRLLTFRIRTSLRFCEGYAIEQLFAECPDIEPGLYVLGFNARIESFLGSFVPMLDDGLMCCRYHNIKLEELMLIMRAYYTKSELAHFFSPMLSAKAEFSDFVMKNYTRVGSVQELASLANYSLSGFEKHFRKVFGVSAAQWLRQKKAGNLYHDLIHTNTPIKQLCRLYGFSSHANMCDFCNRHFKATPTQIRERGKTDLSDE